MWLAILILTPIVIVAHAHYFARRIAKPFSRLGARSNRIADCARIGYLGLSYSVPILIATWVGYVAVLRPDQTSPPAIFWLDSLVIVPFWVITVYSVQCSLLIAPIDFVYWIAGKLRGEPLAGRWKTARSVAVAAIAGVFLVYVPARMFVDGTKQTVRKFTVASPNVPRQLDGFRIALISDPQADQHTSAERIAKFVDVVNREKADLVLIAGDIITNRAEYADIAARELGKLRARYGIVSCIGDHENFAFRDRKRSVSTVKNALQSVGIPLLDNEIYYPIADDPSLAVIVATNNYITPTTKQAAERLMEASMKSQYRIVLAHQTGDVLLDAAKDANVDLFVSGHTHGGQVNFWFPFFQPVMARIETPYITGRYQVGRLALIVSSGLGVSVFPFRYRAPATFEVITLRRAENRESGG